MSAPTNLEAIQAVLSSERFLDSPVTEYRPKSIGAKFDLGTASTLCERSVACREVFTRACQVGTNIGAEELLSTFVSESDNPFVKVIQDTIKELLEAH